MRNINLAAVSGGALAALLALSAGADPMLKDFEYAYQSLTSDMIFCQPVVYEFGNIRVPMLLMIGEKDNTAIGKNRAPAEVRERIGNYKGLGPETAKAIAVVTFPDYGHAPQIPDPDGFNETLLAGTKN
jgi:pimeloyl-ACP methyl ester carboxylesterase